MARPRTIASTYVRFGPVKLPPELMAALRARAEASGAPINTEIILALRKGLKMPLKPALADAAS